MKLFSGLNKRIICKLETTQPSTLKKFPISETFLFEGKIKVKLFFNYREILSKWIPSCTLQAQGTALVDALWFVQCNGIYSNVCKLFEINDTICTCYIVQRWQLMKKFIILLVIFLKLILKDIVWYRVENNFVTLSTDKTQ